MTNEEIGKILNDNAVHLISTVNAKEIVNSLTESIIKFIQEENNIAIKYLVISAVKEGLEKFQLDYINIFRKLNKDNIDTFNSLDKKPQSREAFDSQIIRK